MVVKEIAMKNEPQLDHLATAVKKVEVAERPAIREVDGN